MVPAYFKPYFTPSEFDSPDLPGSGIRMNAMFISMLNKARSIAGIPFYINSGYRTPAHNKKVGGVPGSAHTKGLAADIAVTPVTYGKVLSALLKAGFKRITLTPQQRQNIMKKIADKLTYEEIVLLHKAMNNPIIKNMAIKELKKRL